MKAATRSRSRQIDRARLLAMAASVATIPVSTAHAGLTYDLRFSDGSHTKVPSFSDTYSLELWARVSGTDSTVTDEALAFSYIEIISTETNGGAMASGGLTSNFLAPGFNEAGSRPGGPADLNGDGISDWGSTSTAAANTNYMLARNATPTTGVFAGGTLGQAINANTWEFKLASFTLNVDSPGGFGTTSFNVVQPNMKAVSGAFTYASARVDGTAFPVTSTSPGSAYSGSLGAVIGEPDPPPPPPPATLTWDGGATSSGNAWLTAANWSVDPATSTEHVPSRYDIAQFGAGGTASVIGIDMGAATNEGAARQSVDSIVLRSDANRDIAIENASATTDGKLRILTTWSPNALANFSLDRTLTIQKTGSAGKKLDLELPGFPRVEVTNPNATIVIASDIVLGGNWLNKYGQGHLVISGVSSQDFWIHEGRATITSTGIVGDFVSTDAGATLQVDGALSGTSIWLQANGSVTLNNTSQPLRLLTGAGTLNLAGPTALTVNSVSNNSTFSGSLTGGGSLTKEGPLSLTLSGPLSYTGATTVNAGTLILGSSLRNGAFLDIREDARLQLTPRTSSGAKTLQVGTIWVAFTGTLDLADNDLVVENALYTEIRARVLAGFGHTSGGITSSTSNGSQILALFDNALVGATQWNGGNIGPNAIVGKYTYFGDMNLDGQVTGDDYTVIDANLNLTPPVGMEWLMGDANLDGTVTGDDYTVLDANLGLGSGNPLAANTFAAVPEPATAAVLATMLLGRRRRRNLLYLR